MTVLLPKPPLLQLEKNGPRRAKHQELSKHVASRQGLRRFVSSDHVCSLIQRTVACHLVGLQVCFMVWMPWFFCVSSHHHLAQGKSAVHHYTERLPTHPFFLIHCKSLSSLARHGSDSTNNAPTQYDRIRPRAMYSAPAGWYYMGILLADISAESFMNQLQIRPACEFLSSVMLLHNRRA